MKLRGKIPYREREIWGWDNGSIFFDPNGEMGGDGYRRLQDHPELMDRIIELCREFFTNKEERKP